MVLEKAIEENKEILIKKKINLATWNIIFLLLYLCVNKKIYYFN
jgi:hypothetical protein